MVCLDGKDAGSRRQVTGLHASGADKGSCARVCRHADILKDERADEEGIEASEGAEAQ